MRAALRTYPFPDFQVLDVLVYMTALGTGLTAREPFINFDKVIALIL